MKLPLSKKRLLLIGDIALIPGLLLCRLLTALMLSQETECLWLKFGGKCITCGGTHFVHCLVRGELQAAFWHNQFLFVLTVCLLLSYILLHLHWLGNVPFAGKVLRRVYSIPGLIVACAAMLGFFFARNIAVFQRVFQLLTQ